MKSGVSIGPKRRQSMNKIEEIKKMLDYISDVQSVGHSWDRTIYNKNNIYTINCIFNPRIDFNMIGYDTWRCVIDFNANSITMTTALISGHNGDEYGEESKTLNDLSIVESKYDHIKSLFSNAVEYDLKKETIKKEQEVKNLVIDNRMKQILNGIE